MKPAINVENLGKRYTVRESVSHSGYRTLRESIAEAVSAPFRRMRSNARAADDFWALRDVSFDVSPGDVVGVIGRNGAGKSTLLKVLSRITDPTCGHISIRGRIGSLLEVGTGFHPELTGRENIYLNGAILGMTRREIARQFDQIVCFSGVERFLNTPVKRYSSGMIVRLAFSVAAHLDPEILIIDEVLAVGDAEFQRKCLGKMGEVARSGRTILFVSHNMAAVESLCRRGIYLEGGEINFDGSQSEAVRLYNARTTQDLSDRYFLAEADSRLPVRIIKAAVHLLSRCDDTELPAPTRVEFVVTCEAETEVELPAMGIGVETDHGQRIVSLHTNLDRSYRPENVQGQFTFRCIMDRLSLAPGEYNVKLSLENLGTARHVVEPAMVLSIPQYDAYGNGGKAGRGLVYGRQQWSLER